MFAYTIRRIISGILLLVVMSVVTFYLFYASSSTPERFACGPKCTPAQLEVTKKALGYDEPTIVQWGKFAKGFVVGREFPDDEKLREAAAGPGRRLPARLPGLLLRRTARRSTR